MRATVIGANSYIARNVIETLKNDKDYSDLYLYDREEKQVDGVANYEKINILDKNSISRMNFDVDTIFMFVGKTGSADGFSDPDVFLDINERALLYVLNEYVAHKSHAKLIFPSTRLLYDNNSHAVEDDTSSKLRTLYAINKFACEKYIEMYHDVYGIEYAIARICIPYGSMIPGASSYGTTEFMVSKAEKGENITLYGNGSPRRTLTYIGDLCKALDLIAKNPKCKNEVYNIGGEEYSLAEMANNIAKVYGVSVDFVEYPDIAGKIESGDTVFDDRKLKMHVGEYLGTKFSDWINNKK